MSSNPRCWLHVASRQLRRCVVVGSHTQSLLLHVTRVPQQGETVLGWGYQEPFDGGKATNQAVALARLGVPVAFITAFGDDERGHRIRRYLENEQIDLTYAAVTTGATDVGFVVLPDNGIPAIVTATDKSTQVNEALVARAAPIFQEASCVLAQLEAPYEAALAAFTLAHAAGAQTVLNPAPAAALDERLVAQTDVLVPNEHEAAFLAEREAEIPDLAELLRCQLAIPTVIVTAGAQGAFLADNEAGVHHLRPPQVRAVDTTGAGDAFIGALVSRLHHQRPVLEAARFAVLYATRSVVRSGTLPAYPSLGEMEADLAALQSQL